VVNRANRNKGAYQFRAVTLTEPRLTSRGFFFGAPGRAHSLGGVSPLHTRQGEVLADVLTGGLPDETILSRWARGAEQHHKLDELGSKFLDVFEHDHGAKGTGRRHRAR
jgi:hypothetical protein